MDDDYPRELDDAELDKRYPAFDEDERPIEARQPACGKCWPSMATRPDGCAKRLVRLTPKIMRERSAA